MSQITQDTKRLSLIQGAITIVGVICAIGAGWGASKAQLSQTITRVEALESREVEARKDVRDLKEMLIEIRTDVKWLKGDRR